MTVDLLESVLRGAESVVGGAARPDGSMALRGAGQRSTADGPRPGPGTAPGTDPRPDAESGRAVVVHRAGSPAVRCLVTDGGATAPRLRHPRTTDEGGRGLLLVSRTARRWGTRFVPDGKIIWAEQSLTDPDG